MDIKLPRLSRQRMLAAGGALALLVLIQLFFCWRWSREPPLYLESTALAEFPPVTGYVTTTTLVALVDWLLEKPGGYLSNDIYPPSVWLDNIPNFEFGALVQARDLGRALRNDYSRSQSQSTEHPELAIADPALHYTNDQWIYPSTQTKLREAQDALITYRSQLASVNAADAQFYARADNLREWLGIVERRLGSLSQRLSASVGQTRINTDLAGEPAAESSTPQDATLLVKTRWTELDDVFFEARGAAWALLQFMAAAQVDFDGILTDKNAVVSLQQVMRELEGALEPLRSPVILNGGGYGFFANHSLVLASYLSRAHSAVIDLRALLAQG
ncbi:MAG TPA: DUF2333 family protein [Gammaproteobacteria bacterium]